MKDKGKILVDFTPNPSATNYLIKKLNEDVVECSEQEFASTVATHIAAFAYIMHSSNTTATIKHLFSEIVEEAGMQFRNRQVEDAKSKLRLI